MLASGENGDVSTDGLAQGGHITFQKPLENGLPTVGETPFRIVVEVLEKAVERRMSEFVIGLETQEFLR